MEASIYIVDDHPLYCDGLVSLLSREPGIELCGVANAASVARDEIPTLQPDLVLLDLALKDGSGLDLIQYFRNVLPDLKMIVLSAFDEELYAERSLRSGARGYLMKSAGVANLTRAIRMVLNGELYVSDAIRQSFVERTLGQRSNENHVRDLSDREFEIFRLIGEGTSTSAIADRLHLSPKTVDSHRRSMQGKLGLSSTKELVRHATRWWIEQMS